MVAIDPDNKEWRLEPVYANTNLGVILLEERQFREASAIFQHSLPAIE